MSKGLIILFDRDHRITGTDLERDSMENRFGKIADYIVNNEPEYADKLVSSIELTASCLKEIKERIAEGIHDSIKRSDYNAVNEKVAFCQDLDALVADTMKYAERLRVYNKDSLETNKNENNDNVGKNNNIGTTGTMPKKGMSRVQSQNQKKDKVTDTEHTHKSKGKDAVMPEPYKISFFSREKSRLFVSNARSFYLDVSNDKKRVRLIPITVDTKNHIIYMNMESYYEHASKFMKGIIIIQNYSGTERLEIKIDPYGLPDLHE